MHKNPVSKVFFLISLATLGYSEAPNNLSNELELVSQKLSPGSFGGMFLDVKSGKVIASVSEETNFTPASVAKLITTLAALKYWDENHRFETFLGYTGNLKEQKLEGDLIIKGGGDPAFGSSHFSGHSAEEIFSKWLAELQKKKILSIDGCVRPDVTILPEAIGNRHALWEDIGNYYAARPSALCFFDNLYYLIFKGSEKIGERLEAIGTHPAHTGIRTFISMVNSGRKNGPDSAFIFGSHLSDHRVITGSYPSGRKTFKIKGSLPHPSYTAAMNFQEFLASKGIVFSNQENCGEDPESRKVRNVSPHFLTKHNGPELSFLINRINQHSDNLYADQLKALMPYDSMIQAVVSKNGLSLDQIRLYDGSGLSRASRLSPLALAKILSHATSEKKFGAFRNSLVGGKGAEGKLRRIGNGWENKLWVKTGSMGGIANLAGYMNTQSKRLVVFVLYTNHSSQSTGTIFRVYDQLLKKAYELIS